LTVELFVLNAYPKGMKMIPLDHHMIWNGEHQQPDAVLEILIDAGKKAGKKMTASQAVTALQAIRAEMNAYDAYTTSMEVVADETYRYFPEFSKEEKLGMIHQFEKMVQGKARQIEQSNAMYEYFRASEIWQDHLNLLDAQRRHSHSVLKRAKDFADGVCMNLKAMMSGDTAFTFNACRMNEAIDSGFDVLPREIGSFEDFDKWMAG